MRMWMVAGVYADNVNDFTATELDDCAVAQDWIGIWAVLSV